jgi:hypothetical protein
MKITVEHKEQSSKDIFKPGSLVLDKKDGSVVLVCASVTSIPEHTFTGVAINSVGHFHSGYFELEFDKQYFTKFVGTITLEQE